MRKIALVCALFGSAAVWACEIIEGIYYSNVQISGDTFNIGHVIDSLAATYTGWDDATVEFSVWVTIENRPGGVSIPISKTCDQDWEETREQYMSFYTPPSGGGGGGGGGGYVGGVGGSAPWSGCVYGCFGQVGEATPHPNPPEDDPN
jgi:hypothetical protein